MLVSASLKTGIFEFNSVPTEICLFQIWIVLVVFHLFVSFIFEA